MFVANGHELKVTEEQGDDVGSAIMQANNYGMHNAVQMRTSKINRFLHSSYYNKAK